MIVWLDAQLPPQLAQWMQQEFGLDTKSLRDLGLRDAPDQEIFAKAHVANVILISKDSDFVNLVQANGPPPQLIWLTCGNVTNTRLRTVLQKSWQDVAALLAAGEAIVELGDD